MLSSVDWYLLPTFRDNISVQWSSGPQNIDDVTTKSPRNIPEERKPHLHRGKTLISRKDFTFIHRENINVCLIDVPTNAQFINNFL